MTTRFIDHLLEGDHASRPAFGDVPQGSLYACTTHSLIYQSDGSAWSTWWTGTGVLDILDIPTAETDNSLVLAPDGAGGVEFRAETGGVGGGGGSGRPLVDPTGLSWSWLNQGSATITDNGEALSLFHGGNSADEYHLRVKSVPSKPYSVIIHTIPSLMGQNFGAAGVGWLQTSNNDFAICSHYGLSGGYMLTSSLSTSDFLLASHYIEIGVTQFWPWIKLTDSATVRTVSVSQDGWNWILLHSVATDTNVTPDRLIFGVNPRNATWGAGLTIDSWEEA